MPKTIPITRASEPASWQQQLAQAISEPRELLRILQLEPSDCEHFSIDNEDFGIKVPLAYIAKMQRGNPDDPLLLQVMTQHRERLDTPGYDIDPVGDIAANKVAGLLHKYPGRVLLITTQACAVHCRYCFRRHFPYQQQKAANQQWADALDYIRSDSSIREVILSGGDPLVLSDDRLQSLIEQLELIPHLSRLRIHTRLPVVLPDRITAELVDVLGQCRFDVCMVIHANHANEIGMPEAHALGKLRSAGIHLLNQAVLLHQVNHRLEQQIELAEALYRAGVLPYYLHLLDPVAGAAHFNTSQRQALRLVRQMRQQLPGYLVPRLVREVAGEKSKTPADEL